MNTNKQWLPFLYIHIQSAIRQTKKLVIFFNISIQSHKKAKRLYNYVCLCLLYQSSYYCHASIHLDHNIPIVQSWLLLLQSSIPKHGHNNHYGFMIQAYPTKTGTDRVATIYIQSIVIALSVPKRVCTHLIAKYTTSNAQIAIAKAPILLNQFGGGKEVQVDQ